MKAGIHPVYETKVFHCYGCSTEFESRTTLKPHSNDGKIHLDVCASCHPFFTGKQKLMDKAGRVDRFNKRYAKSDAAKSDAAKAKAETETEASNG
ncbi:MAG: 50S ribosomal protein L31 [Candidatus Eisenbacteria bacterium]